MVFLFRKLKRLLFLIKEIEIKTQTIDISQDHLFTMVRNEQDSIKVSNENIRIGNPASKENRFKWREAFKTYELKTFELIYNNENKQLNTTIKLNYNSKEKLKESVIDYIEEDNS